MSERSRFVALHQEGLYSMSELCSRFQISRKTGYKWLARFEEQGLEGLADQSRAPHSCPQRTAPVTEAALLAAKQAHPTWGPKKLLPYLQARQPHLPLPAPSTAGAILARHGATTPRRSRRPKNPPVGRALTTTAPNEVWAADFKGEFLTGDGRLCYPLTIMDAHTRYLLLCHGLPSTATGGVLPLWERLFAEYGLPTAIRTDNGTPFASVAVCGLSALSIWWLKLGIEWQRITPGRPQQNGRHERMHRTLKAETARPPAKSGVTQQARFDAFRQEYNEERPHEALGQVPPAQQYVRSTRSLPARLPRPEYAGHYQVRKVGSNGMIQLRQARIFLSETLSGEYVGLEEVADQVWSVYFYRLLLGRFDEQQLRLVG
jgi:transposase InsO family protein